MMFPAQYLLEPPQMCILHHRRMPPWVHSLPTQPHSGLPQGPSQRFHHLGIFSNCKSYKEKPTFYDALSQIMPLAYMVSVVLEFIL
jgi:hypothetical protein